MKYRYFLTVFLCAAILAGCGSSVNLSKVTETTVGINSDGSVEEVIIEDFEMDYYSLEDLTAYVESEVAAFNAENPQEGSSSDDETAAITVQSIEVDEDAKTARLALSYLSISLYNAFNGTELELLTVEDVVSSDSFISEFGDSGLIDAKSGETVALKDFSDNGKLNILCADTSMNICVSGKIMYYSESATLVDNKTIQTADGQSVIVFK